MNKVKLSQKPIHPMPFVRLELAIFTVMDDALHVLLGKRTEAPHAGKWALPGGALRIDLDSDLVAASRRIANERLGAELPNVSQLCAVGSRHRDPRAPWALSVVYKALIPLEQIDATPGKRLDALRWVPADEAAADSTLAFDHAELIGKAASEIRNEFDTLQFPIGFLDETFSFLELHAASTAILGRSIDKSSFRRRLTDRGCLEEVPGAMKTGTFRPAQLFRLRLQS